MHRLLMCHYKIIWQFAIAWVLIRNAWYAAPCMVLQMMVCFWRSSSQLLYVQWSVWLMYWECLQEMFSKHYHMCQKRRDNQAHWNDKKPHTAWWWRRVCSCQLESSDRSNCGACQGSQLNILGSSICSSCLGQPYRLDFYSAVGSNNVTCRFQNVTEFQWQTITHDKLHSFQSVWTPFVNINWTSP